MPDVPPSLNKLFRLHWARRMKLKEHWGWMIRWELPPTYLKPLVRMRVTVTMHHSRLFDKDNAYGAAKVIFDVLKQQKLIVDDSAEYLEAKVEQEKCPHKQRHTVIEIEAL